MLQKILFILTLLLFYSTIGFMQTKEIAFKSHSGNMRYFSPQHEGNFGLEEPFYSLDSIVRRNDSTIIKYYNTIDAPYLYDTIYNHPLWIQSDFNLDSTKKTYDSHVLFIGFENEQQKTPKKRAKKLRKRKKNG